MTRHSKGTVQVLACLLFGLTGSAWVAQAQSGGDAQKDRWGPNYRPRTDVEAPTRQTLTVLPPTTPPNAMAMLRHWNHFAVDMSGLDHMQPGPGEERVFGEQLGPARAARAMAIVHIAMFDAVNAFAGKYRGYTALPRAPVGASMQAAIAQAAHDTLVAMFPSQRPASDEVLADDLASIPTGTAKTEGIRLGKRAAALILARRANDGSQHAEPRVGIEFITSNAPGKWRQDPISQVPIAMGAYWGKVRPFVIPSAVRFRVPPPPAMESEEYAEAYNEVKRLGGDGIGTPTDRTGDQTIAANYWAYDGTPSLCAPPRMYNQIVMQIAEQMGSSVLETARLVALVNVAMADAGIAVWESKYYYSFWRPITAIREADEGTGPTGAGDGNPATSGDPNFVPLGAPASNLTGPNFTPPFPAYTSGHAGFGGAVFQVLRRFYGTDRITFTFVSDEYNGVTLDNDGQVRPLIPRTFRTLSQAEEENGQSRIYLGIHFGFDKTDGIAQGRRIGNYVVNNAFQRVQ
jgi:hypothetical protein